MQCCRRVLLYVPSIQNSTIHRLVSDSCKPDSYWSANSTLLQDWEEGDGDFVAPELLRPGAHAEPSADIYSFGATIYELATGDPSAKDPYACRAMEPNIVAQQSLDHSSPCCPQVCMPTTLFSLAASAQHAPGG